MTAILKSALIIVVGSMLLAGCGGSVKPNPTDPGYVGQQGPASSGSMPGGSILGDDSVVFGTAKQRPNDSGGAGGTGGGALGVNAYLWRGALDTLSFMPLASADPFGGVIITDWYTPPTSSNERFKATAYILGRELRSDGVRVSIFRQVLQDGHWVDSSVSPVTVGEIENKVLARARELREQSMANSS
ncbi:MAG TPA: DUF3576 domain-containing protein [Acetobacteraceae bacterium]|nr:DUF3576 domain-containing protein [Acetobacteraceae bacterium]